MLIACVDKKGRTIWVSREQIKESLRAMGVSGVVGLEYPSQENEAKGEGTVVRVRLNYNPYGFVRNLWFKASFYVNEFLRVRELKKNAPDGFRIEMNEYVFVKPWVQLKNDEQHLFVV